MLSWNLHSPLINPFATDSISLLLLLDIYIGKNLLAFPFANKKRFEIFSQYFEYKLYRGDSDWAIPNEFRPMQVKCLHNVDINIVIFV